MELAGVWRAEVAVSFRGRQVSCTFCCCLDWRVWEAGFGRVGVLGWARFLGLGGVRGSRWLGAVCEWGQMYVCMHGTWLWDRGLALSNIILLGSIWVQLQLLHEERKCCAVGVKRNGRY